MQFSLSLSLSLSLSTLYTTRGQPLRVHNLQLSLAPVLLELALPAKLAILRALIADGVRGHGDITQRDAARLFLPV